MTALEPCRSPLRKSRDTIRRWTISISGTNSGAGESRTPDKQFRKLLLYPSELQPHTRFSLSQARQNFLTKRSPISDALASLPDIIFPPSTPRKPALQIIALNSVRNAPGLLWQDAPGPHLPRSARET